MKLFSKDRFISKNYPDLITKPQVKLYVYILIVSIVSTLTLKDFSQKLDINLNLSDGLPLPLEPWTHLTQLGIILILVITLQNFRKSYDEPFFNHWIMTWVVLLLYYFFKSVVTLFDYFQGDEKSIEGTMVSDFLYAVLSNVSSFFIMRAVLSLHGFSLSRNPVLRISIWITVTLFMPFFASAHHIWPNISQINSVPISALSAFVLIVMGIAIKQRLEKNNAPIINIKLGVFTFVSYGVLQTIYPIIQEIEEFEAFFSFMAMLLKIMSALVVLGVCFFDENYRMNKAIDEKEKSSEKFNLFLNKCKVAHYKVDKDGVIIETSAAEIEILGYDNKTDVLNKKRSELYYEPSDEKEFMKDLSSMEKVFYKDVRLRKKEGTPIWVKAFVIKSDDNGGEGREGVYFDFTKERTEKKISEIKNNVNNLYSELDRKIANEPRIDDFIFELMRGIKDIFKLKHARLVIPILSDSQASKGAFLTYFIDDLNEKRIECFSSVEIMSELSSSNDYSISVDIQNSQFIHSITITLLENDYQLQEAVKFQYLLKEIIKQAEVKLILAASAKQENFLKQISLEEVKSVEKEAWLKLFHEFIHKEIYMDASFVFNKNPEELKVISFLGDRKGIDIDKYRKLTQETKEEFFHNYSLDAPNSSSQTSFVVTMIKDLSQDEIGFFVGINRRRQIDDSKNIASPFTPWDIKFISFATRVIAPIMKAQVEELQRVKWLDVFSHEFQNPINHIRNNIQVIEKRKYSESERFKRFEKIYFYINHSYELLSSLELLRARDLTLNKEKANLSGIIYDSIESNSIRYRRVRRQRVYIDDDALKSLPFFLIDKSRMFQVFSNLFGNSFKYAKRDQDQFWIKVGVKELHDSYSIIIVDNGIGIEDNYARRVFEFGVRSKRAIQYRSDGLGMGLGLAKKILELHGGKLELTRNSEPTVFTVTLPKKEIK